MADPRESPVETRKNPLSPLMRALTQNKAGEKVNFCPFGCEVEDLDDHGYCRHLIGFTNSSPTDCKNGKGVFEPMVKQQGRRIVQVKRPRIARGPDEEGIQQFEEGPPDLPAVKKTDKLVQITVSHRVYRDVDADNETKAPASVAKKLA